MDRQTLLREVGRQLEPSLWRFIDHLDETLGNLVKVPHIDANDPAAIGSVVHSSIKSAIVDTGLAELGFEHSRDMVGPGNKIAGTIDIDGKRRKVSIELHYAGPNGGTRKSRHQSAASDAEELEFPGFETLAPEDVLLFLAYSISAGRGRIAGAFLVYADGVDKKKFKLHRPVTVSTAEPAGAGVPVAAVSTGTKIKIKKPKVGEAGDVRSSRKRGDDTSRS